MDELAELLAFPHSPQHARDLLEGRISLRGPDREDRARIIFQIYRIISQLFVDPAMQAEWLRAQNPMLRGRSPLAVMLTDRIPGLITVRNLADRLVGR